MRPRIAQELALLRQFYPNIQHLAADAGDWFLLPEYTFPPGWRDAATDGAQSKLCLFIGSGYPTAEPYAFLIPATAKYQDNAPNNATNASPPFEGAWLQLSWAPDGWFPEADVRNGSNLLAWVRSFSERLKEGR
jgi:hypothetical protein